MKPSPDGFCERPERIFNCDFVSGLHSRRRRGEEKQPQPVMARAHLVVGEQINFRIVERRQVQFASGDAQFHPPGNPGSKLFYVGGHPRSRDASVGVGVHRLAFAGGPFLEKSQIQREVQVSRAGGEMDAVLNKVGENVMRCGRLPQGDQAGHEQQPGGPRHAPPTPKPLVDLTHAKFPLPPFYLLLAGMAIGKAGGVRPNPRRPE